MSKVSPLIVLLLSTALGCASGSRTAGPSAPTPESLPGETPSIPEKATNSGKAWRLTPSPRSDAYTSTIKTSIRQEDSQRTDRLTTITTYSLGLNRIANEVSFSGIVNSFEIQAENVQEPQKFSASVFPLNFDGRISNHSLSIKKTMQPENQISCADSLWTVFSSVEKTVTVPPLELFSNQTWRDSTSMTVCSGSLPVVISMIRTYRVGDQGSFNGVAALILDRTEKILASGQGSQGQHQVAIESNGSGTGQVYVDPVDGSLLGIRAKNETRLSIKSSGLIQNFIQTSEEITDRRNRP